MGAKSTKKTTASSLDVGSKTGVIVLPNKKLKKIPAVLLKNTNQYHKIRSLDLSSNLLTKLDDDLTHFKALKTLNLSKNRLISLVSAAQLKSLQNLDISHNDLVSLPILPGKLQKINVSCNQIAIVECGGGGGGGGGEGGDVGGVDDNWCLPKLKEIDLSSNVIVGLTSSMFAVMQNLERLDLSNNHLEMIDPSIGTLMKLVHLNLRKNRLVALPPELGACKGLQTVLAANNMLETVPTELLENGALSNMRLEGNRMIKSQFLAIEGVEEFMERRKARLNREIHGGMHGTDRSVCGLD